MVFERDADAASDCAEWIKSVNDHLGARIKSRRKQLNMSQSKLGKAIGLTFQQVQKYEHGSNRINAAQLLNVAKALDVPVTFFFEGMPVQIAPMTGFAEQQDAFGTDQASTAEADVAELVSAYRRIRDPKLRQQVVALLRSLPSGAG